MRARLIRPAYWTDADLHTRLTAEQREFYIGLWMLADDAGYVAWDVDRIGAEMYPYRPHLERVALMAEWLVVIGPAHARLLECGKHVLVPNLSKHQSSPRPSYTVQTAHGVCLRHLHARARTDEQMRADEEQTQSKGGSGSKGFGTKGGAAALDEKETTTSSFRDRVGMPTFLGGGEAPADDAPLCAECGHPKRSVSDGTGRWVCTFPHHTSTAATA